MFFETRLVGQFLSLFIERSHHITGRSHDLHRSQQCFIQIKLCGIDRIAPGNGITDHSQRLIITLRIDTVRIGPCLERPFLFLLFTLHIESFDAARHSDCIFPIVRRLGIFRRILNAHLVTGRHIFGQNFLTFAANEDSQRIGNPQQPIDFIRRHITLRRAWETHDHGEIALLITVE